VQCKGFFAMPERPDPFDTYIAQVLRHLQKLSLEQQEQIAEELRAHLEDAAAASGEQSNDPSLRARIVSQMGAPRPVGRALARVHAPVTPWQIADSLRKVAIGLVAAVTFMFFILSIWIVPAPTPQNSIVITGKVASISPPHPELGDMRIRLEDGRRFYVNRANEQESFAWERLLQEVQPGDTIHLTTVRSWAWRAIEPGYGASPVAGVRTDSVVYMDPEIPARTWTAAKSAQQDAWRALALLCLLCTPDLFKFLRQKLAV
jgi:hypothetical protein